MISFSTAVTLMVASSVSASQHQDEGYYHGGKTDRDLQQSRIVGGEPVVEAGAFPFMTQLELLENQFCGK